MDSVQTDPVTIRQVVAALIGESDDRSRQLGQRLAAWREGYAAGFAAGVEVGRGAEAAERDQAHHELARRVIHGEPYGEVERRRWRLRGQDRTRATFSQPHPADYRPGSVVELPRRSGGAA